VTCASTTPGTALPVGRYDLAVPITRVGPLRVHDGSVAYVGPGVNSGDSYPINDLGTGPKSTAEIRQVAVDLATGQADLPMTLNVLPGDVINTVWITVSSRYVWEINRYHRANLHGLECRTDVQGFSENIVCTGPGGGPLPVGQTSIVLPLITYAQPSALLTAGDVAFFRNNNTVGENVDSFPFVF